MQSGHRNLAQIREAPTGLNFEEPKNVPSWLDPDLTKQYLAAIALVPEDHLIPPYEGETFLSKVEAQQRFKDKAFSEGFAVVNGRQSGRNSLHMVCSHHGLATKNTRKLEEDDRKRVNTHVQQLHCKWHVRGTNRQGCWSVTTLVDLHNHAPASDPFCDSNNSSYLLTKAAATVESSILRRAGTTHSQARAILGQKGLTIGKKAYYNSVRPDKEEAGPRTEKAEAERLLDVLEKHQWHCRPKYKGRYDEDGEELQGHSEIEHIFFTSSKMITLAKRFTCHWVMEVDATFNTNSRRLPLLILSGITNTMQTFPIGFAFIISESKAAFSHVFSMPRRAGFRRGKESARGNSYRPGGRSHCSFCGTAGHSNTPRCEGCPC